MDAEIKRKWVEALRSGKYKQGRDQLQNGDTYCCLGVLCVVAGLPIFSGNSTDPGNVSYQGIYDLGVHHLTCPKLWSMNDSGRPFPEIADYIEANL